MCSWRRETNEDGSSDSNISEDEDQDIISSDESDSSPRSKYTEIKGTSYDSKREQRKSALRQIRSSSDSSDSDYADANKSEDSSVESPEQKDHNGSVPAPVHGKNAEENIISLSDTESKSSMNQSPRSSNSPNSSSIINESPNASSGNIHPQNLTKERQAELINAKRFYKIELEKEMQRLHSLKTTIKTLKIETLPDKGAKLRSSIEKQNQKVKELNEQLNHVSKSIEEDTHSNGGSPVNFKPSKPSPSKPIVPSLIDLTKDNTDLSEMGKRALATHQAHQAQTVQTLERLHKFLRKSTENKEIKEPEGLKVSLLPHQKVGLNWLLMREKEIPAGGILADDMGLGKTLTIISLILKDKENKPNEKQKSSEDDDDDDDAVGRRKFPKGHTLVVCPASVMGQWSSEISSKVRGGQLSVCLHHGTKKETRPQALAYYDVVVTTYTILRYENNGTKSNPLLNIRWNRVVLDEAHIIRNYKSQTAQAVFALRAKKRWALTGTPIHNKQEDYFSLLKFLRCKPFDDIIIWKKMVGNKGDAGMQRLHLITKSLLLRRTKEEIQQSGGLKDLRPKQFNTIEVKLDPEEQRVYDKISHFSSTLLAQYIEQRAEKEDLLKHGLNIKQKGVSNPFKDHPELGRLYTDMLVLKGGVKTHHILVLLLRLRQTCCHPSLVTSMIDKEIDGIEDDAGNDLDLLDRMMNMSIVPDNDDDGSGHSKKILSSDDPVFRVDRCSSKMRAIIDCLTKLLESGTDKAIVVSQWTSVLNILDSFLEQKRIQTVCLNGTVPVKERIGIIEDFNNKPYGPKVLLLSLTAGGTGLNLVGANHLLLIDIHWNPQLEAQACDRIYRVGQKKVVNIYKFLCKETIEERILKLQKQKLELAEGVLTGSAKFSSSKLTIRDLKLLFDIKH